MSPGQTFATRYLGLDASLEAGGYEAEDDCQQPPEGQGRQGFAFAAPEAEGCGQDYNAEEERREQEEETKAELTQQERHHGFAGRLEGVHEVWVRKNEDDEED